MALIMPDINLRRRRRNIERYWRALLHEDIAPLESSPPPTKRSVRRRTSRMAPGFTATSANSRTRLSISSCRSKDSAEPPSTTSAAMSSARLTSTPQDNNQQEECDPAALSGDSGSGSGPTVGAVIDAVSRNEGDTDQLDFSRLAQRNKRLESTGCALVAQALSTNHTVRRLIMRDHAIGDDGAAALADMLCRNSTLEYIDLFGNDITDDGAEALAQALYGHESVTHLLLWSNRITDRGAKALADALKCNIALQYLGLVDNLITQAGVLAFLHALEVNVHLESLDLGANNVPDWLTTQVRVVLARNRLEAPRNKLVLGCASPVIKEDSIARYEAGESEGENNSGHESIGSGESSSSEGSASGFLSCSEITNISSQSSSGMWI